MVTDRDAIKVIAVPTSRALTTLQVTTTTKSDIGKIIGKQGRTARSLRIVLQAVSREQGLDFGLTIDGHPISASN